MTLAFSRMIDTGTTWQWDEFSINNYLRNLGGKGRQRILTGKCEIKEYAIFLLFLPSCFVLLLRL